MELTEMRQTLKGFIELSNQHFDRYRLPLRISVAGVGKFHILQHEVVLRTNDGAVKNITSRNIEKCATELARI